MLVWKEALVATRLTGHSQRSGLSAGNAMMIAIISLGTLSHSRLHLPIDRLQEFSTLYDSKAA